MAESLSDIFERLLAKQQILLERYNVMKEKLDSAESDIKALTDENERQKRRIEKLEMDNNYLQFARQIAPDRESLDKGRALIAKLVRDVDKCIEQLKD